MKLITIAAKLRVTVEMEALAKLGIRLAKIGTLRRVQMRNPENTRRATPGEHNPN